MNSQSIDAKLIRPVAKSTGFLQAHILGVGRQYSGVAKTFEKASLIAHGMFDTDLEC